MNILITIVVIMLQYVVGQILGFGVAFAFQAGNGWELLIMPIGNTLGVWSVGAIASALCGTFSARSYAARLLGTAVASAIGVAIILITPATGMVQIIYPLVGALLGFYLSSRIFSKLSSISTTNAGGV
ncbi:MAG: hypothetical protein GY869_32805 [Planctomycetes bacterium]|nr:hypothetical protein [Planctomycetota bacterium]